MCFDSVRLQLRRFHAACREGCWDAPQGYMRTHISNSGCSHMPVQPSMHSDKPLQCHGPGPNQTEEGWDGTDATPPRRFAPVTTSSTAIKHLSHTHFLRSSLPSSHLSLTTTHGSPPGLIPIRPTHLPAKCLRTDHPRRLRLSRSRSLRVSQRRSERYRLEDLLGKRCKHAPASRTGVDIPILITR